MGVGVWRRCRGGGAGFQWGAAQMVKADRQTDGYPLLRRPQVEFSRVFLNVKGPRLS